MKSKKFSLRGEVSVPCDKSISHRAILFSSFAEGVSRVRVSTIGRDNFASLRAMRQLGVEISGRLSKSMAEIAKSEGVVDGFEIVNSSISEIVINAKGFSGLREPSSIIDCGNSGTTSRLLCGLLAGRPFETQLTGDASLRSRPFKRITEPLRLMGAEFDADQLPLTVIGKRLNGIEYQSKKASAQVKTAILLAGLQATGDVSVIEPVQSRNHSELMLSAMGCSLNCGPSETSWKVSLAQKSKPKNLSPIDIEVPADFSAAGFFLVAASIIPGSELLIKNVGFNETRIGLYQLLEKMGANIEVENKREVGGERVVDLLVRHAPLKGIEVAAEDVVLAIDEIPIFAVAAAFAEGQTQITGAEELRVKESDRISMIVDLFSDLLAGSSVEVEELSDGMKIDGCAGELCPTGLSQASRPECPPKWRESHDHRILMSATVLKLALTGELEVSEAEVVETSFPGFAEQLQAVVCR